MLNQTREAETQRKQDDEVSPAIMSHAYRMESWWKLYQDAAVIEKKLIASGKIPGAYVGA